MAEVFEGYDTRLGRTIAIKLLKSDLANDANFEAKFRQEAQASARMAHPTIVRVYDAGEEESVDENGQVKKTPFIIMELVRGTLLREVIHRGPVEIAKTIRYVSGILTALEVSHAAGVVHRDIKPANVMIAEGDAVKVMDFGIARAVTDNSATQAATGGIMGTAQYFSPEQARGEGVDARTDLYSTGVILYELLAGKPPFTGESAVSVAYQHVSESATPPSQINHLVSPELDAVVMRAMAKDKEARFQSASEFREHLLAAALSTATAPRPTQPAPIADRTEVINTPTQVMSPQATTDELFIGLKTAPTETIKEGGSNNKLGVGVLWGLGTGVAVILIGLLFWVMSLGGANNPVNPGGIPVASVEGSLYDDAYNTLTGQDLLVLRVYEKSDTVPEGVVIRQEPVAGTSVLANTPITLYVSSGATEVLVPNAISKTELEAVQLIEAQGLTIGTITVISSATVPEGVVMATEPAVGERLPLGSVVNLTLSNGKVLVPDVRNLSVLEARTILTAPTIGYTVSIEIIDAPTCQGTPGNVVIEQSILPGEAAQLQNMILYVQCVGGATESPSPEPSPTETTNG